jgi:hypothetical protein
MLRQPAQGNHVEVAVPSGGGGPWRKRTLRVILWDSEEELERDIGQKLASSWFEMADPDQHLTDIHDFNKLPTMMLEQAREFGTKLGMMIANPKNEVDLMVALAKLGMNQGFRAQTDEYLGAKFYTSQHIPEDSVVFVLPNEKPGVWFQRPVDPRANLQVMDVRVTEGRAYDFIQNHEGRVIQGQPEYFADVRHRFGLEHDPAWGSIVTVCTRRPVGVGDMISEEDIMSVDGSPPRRLRGAFMINADVLHVVRRVLPAAKKSVWQWLQNPAV